MEFIISKLEATPYDEKSEHLELEIRTRIDIDSANRLLKHAKKPVLSQTLDIVVPVGDTINNIHTKELVNRKSVSNIYRYKQTLAKPAFIDNATKWKVSIAKEGPTSQFDLLHQVTMRLKHRISWYWNDNWRIDMTLVDYLVKTTVKPTIESMAILKTEADFANYMLKYREVELEIELQFNPKLDPSHYSYETILSIINSVENIIYPDREQQHKTLAVIGEISNLILSRETSDKLKHKKKTLKNISNAVIPATHEVLADIIEDPTNYFITDKADGERVFVYIKNKIMKFVGNKQVIERDVSIDKLYLFDAEYVQNSSAANKSDANKSDANKSDATVYVFDVLYFDGVSYMDRAFEERVALFEQVAKLKIPNVKLKTQFRLSAKIPQDIKAIKSHKTPYMTDGYIVTTNGTYYDKVFKIKHVKDITIDFYCLKCPKRLLGQLPYAVVPGKTLYLLFCGINKTLFAKYKLKKLPDYANIVGSLISLEYFPIQFSPSSNGLAYLYYDANDQLHNKIVELRCGSCSDGPQKPESIVDWQFYRIREDREPSNGYYGNDFKVAESVWESYRNPVTIDMIVDAYEGKIDLGYFKKTNNAFYASVRAFNSYVKSQILTEHITQHAANNDSIPYVVDLGSGRGQDINRYAHSKIEHVLFTDIDSLALTEITNRKATMDGSIKVSTLEVDLSQDAAKTINIIRMVDRQPISLVVCNMAINYLLGNEKQIANFIHLIDGLLDENGYFIATTFDGEAIMELLKETGTWQVHENSVLKYEIVKKFKSDILGIGQQIDVLLPFSNGEMYSEYLVNFNHLTEQFAKANFVEERRESFKTFLDKYANLDKMTDDDKTFVSLYSAIVYKKMPNIAKAKKASHRSRAKSSAPKQ